MSNPKPEKTVVAGDHQMVLPQAASTACSHALRAVGAMASDQSARDALAGLHVLTQKARRAHAHLQPDLTQDGLTREWVEALQLMDQLSATAKDLAGDRLVQTAVELQKSGKTA